MSGTLIGVGDRDTDTIRVSSWGEPPTPVWTLLLATLAVGSVGSWLGALAIQSSFLTVWPYVCAGLGILVAPLAWQGREGALVEGGKLYLLRGSSRYRAQSREVLLTHRETGWEVHVTWWREPTAFWRPGTSSAPRQDRNR